MIVGIGLDLLENQRIERELERGEWLNTDGVFLPAELEQASSFYRPALHLAECFTGKEAALKALGLDISDLGCFRQIEISRSNGFEPKVIFRGQAKHQADQLGVRRVRLSVTRTVKLTGALVILET